MPSLIAVIKVFAMIFLPDFPIGVTGQIASRMRTSPKNCSSRILILDFLKSFWTRLEMMEYKSKKEIPEAEKSLIKPVMIIVVL